MEASNGLQDTSWSEDRGTEWIPNRLPSGAWVEMAKSDTYSSSQCNFEISLQATGTQLVHNSHLFLSYQFLQDMCPVL